MSFYICVMLGGLIGLSAPLQAGNTTPEETLLELEMRINSRFVDELLGPVDFEYAYIKEGADAYPLATLIEFQAQYSLEIRGDSTLVYRRKQPTDHAEEAAVVVVGPEGMTSYASEGDFQAGRALGEPVPVSYTVPFVADPTPIVGGTPMRVRFADDAKGDPYSFDVSAVDLKALESRPLPPWVADIAGIVLGVRIAPHPQAHMPAITQIEAEHALAARRLMRLELQEGYFALPPVTFLHIEPVEVTVEKEQAVAEIKWAWKPDGGPSGKTHSATLVLHQTADGWRIERAWEFIQQLVAAD